MAKDHSLALRRAIIAHLKADTSVTAKQDAERIYGMRQPAQTSWPFTRYGTPDTLPRQSQCSDGNDIAIALHSFSKTPFEDECAEIVAALVESLGGATLTLETGEKAHVAYRGSTIIPDAAEANAWHGIARFEATIA